MLALVLAAAMAAQSPETQPVPNFAQSLEQARTLSAELDDSSPIGMLVLMKLRNEVDTVCPRGPDAIDEWIKRNRLTDVEAYVVGSLCESYWAGRHDSYRELKNDIAPQP